MIRYHAVTEAGRHAVLSVDTDEHDESFVPTQIRSARGVSVLARFPEYEQAVGYASQLTVSESKARR
jgi:hypothetical protein